MTILRAKPSDLEIILISGEDARYVISQPLEMPVLILFSSDGPKRLDDEVKEADNIATFDVDEGKDNTDKNITGTDDMEKAYSENKDEGKDKNNSGK